MEFWKHTSVYESLCSWNPYMQYESLITWNPREKYETIDELKHHNISSHQKSETQTMLTSPL